MLMIPSHARATQTTVSNVIFVMLPSRAIKSSIPSILLLSFAAVRCILAPLASASVPFVSRHIRRLSRPMLSMNGTAQGRWTHTSGKPPGCGRLQRAGLSAVRCNSSAPDTTVPRRRRGQCDPDHTFADGGPGRTGLGELIGLGVTAIPPQSRGRVKVEELRAEPLKAPAAG